SAPRVTPSRMLVPVLVRVAPPLELMVPPVIVPLRFHEPVVELPIASVALVLVSVPVRLTVPPLRLIVPRPDVVKLPPRFNVPLLTLIVPLLLHVPARFNVPPLTVVVAEELS